MEGVKYTNSDLREVGKKVFAKWAEYLPVLREMSTEIGSIENGIKVLEPVVHNLSVMASEKIYQLIEPVYRIYNDFDLRGKSNEEKESIRKMRKVIGDLRKLEREEFEHQKADGLEEEYMQHVECDMSGFYKVISYFMMMGYECTELQMHYLEESVKICQDITRYAIARGETAMRTSEQMMKA